MRHDSDQTAVVTGGSSGLGEQLALHLARHGVKVALMARRDKHLKEVQARIRAEGGEAITVPVDIGSAAAVVEAFAKIDKRFGRLDFLFNCAGVVEPVAPLVKATDIELTGSLNTNLLGVYVATREALRRMTGQDHGGTIVNITSGAARNAYAGWSVYSGVKAAMDMLTRCVALEIEDAPVRIAAIAPGIFESRMQQVMRGVDPDDFPAREKFIELHETGQLVGPEVPARFIVDIAMVDWPELNGMVTDVRFVELHKECARHGITIPEEYA